ncbi:MAG: hypothetical protein ABIG63_12330 [Chloroflexota bacterium]
MPVIGVNTASGTVTVRSGQVYGGEVGRCDPASEGTSFTQGGDDGRYLIT